MYKAFVLIFDSSYDAILCASYYNFWILLSSKSPLEYTCFLTSLKEVCGLNPFVYEFDSNSVYGNYSCFVELFVSEEL